MERPLETGWAAGSQRTLELRWASSAHSGAQLSSRKLRVTHDSSEGPLGLCHDPFSCLCPYSPACFFGISVCLLWEHSFLVPHLLDFQPWLCLPLLFLDGGLHTPCFQP